VEYRRSTWRSQLMQAAGSRWSRVVIESIDFSLERL
jgi:hypothetical protein